MEKKSKNSYTPILPFDPTLGENFTTYNNKTYRRDVDLCNQEAIAPEHTKVYKFYRCAQQEPYQIGGDKNNSQTK